MTPTISSESWFTAADYTEYLRCPRTVHLRLTGEWPPDETRFPAPSDREEVLAHALKHLKLPGGEAHYFHHPPFSARADVRHPQKPTGYASVIIREASSLKRSYLLESMFLRFCAEKTGETPERQYVVHLNKGYQMDMESGPEGLYVQSDVTRRAGVMLTNHRKRLDSLADELAADPQLEKYRHRRCNRRYCEVCSRDAPQVPDWHVTTLYRGYDLVDQFLDEGITSIIDVPPERLPHPRQRIQQRALREGRPVIDDTELEEFVTQLSYPLHYLDFEAVNPALPLYRGTKPWEHVPYLFSIHSEDAPDEPPRHHAFMMEPGEDQREQMIRDLIGVLSGSGGVVVYGAQFESGVLSRLAVAFPSYADALDKVRSRLVDLLLPFKEFVFYDARQRGKVSLKTVLPLLSEDLYEGLPIRDGYHANVAYRYLRTAATHSAPGISGGEPALSHGEIAAALVEYCTMDTLAMVRIVSRLRILSGGTPPIRPQSNGQT